MPRVRSLFSPVAAPDDRAAAVVAALGLALLAAVLAARGAPWPNTDDPAFAGVGIELARSGQLWNPFLAGFLTDLHMSRCYLQPPLHSYTMAGWIRLFGVGTESFRAFAWIWYGVGIIGLVRLVRDYGLSTAAGLVLAGCYLLAVAGTGLRPEAEASALLFLGLSLLDYTTRFPQKLAALVLLGLAALAYPLALAIAVPFALARWELDRPAMTSRLSWLGSGLRLWGPALALALPMVALAFLLMIRYDLEGFLAGYRAHLAYRRGYIALDGGTLHYFKGAMLDGGEKVLTLPVVAALAVAAGWIAWRRRSVPAGVRLLVLACVAASATCVALYVVTATIWVVLLAFGALAAVAGALPRRGARRVALAAVALLAGWHHFPGFIDLAERQPPDPAALQAAARAAEDTRKPLMVDASTWRYVFDYRVPEGTADASFSAPLAALPSARTWIIAPARSGEKCRVALPSDFERVPRETLGGHAFQTQPLCPDQPAVIR